MNAAGIEGKAQYRAETGNEMKLDDFKTLAVVSIEDGAKLGYVDDLLFDTKNRRLAALRVKEDGVHALVPLSDVRSIGSDAVTVQSRAVARSAAAENELASLPGVEQFKKLKVVDEAGTYLGTVREVDVDPADGHIAQIDAHEGGMLGLGGTTSSFTGDQIRSIGDELIIVTLPATGDVAATGRP
jgi:sporulation protein YlmC with PRC-barrel domain